MLRNVCVKANVPDSGATVRESVLEGLLPQPSPGLRRIAARLCDTVWLALASYRLLARTIVHTGLFSLSLSLRLYQMGCPALTSDSLKLLVLVGSFIKLLLMSMCV